MEKWLDVLVMIIMSIAIIVVTYMWLVLLVIWLSCL